MAAGNADRPAIRICVTLSATAAAGSGAKVPMSDASVWIIPIIKCPAHVLRGGGYARQLQGGQLVGLDVALDRGGTWSRVAVELHIGVAHHVSPKRKALAGFHVGGADGGLHAFQLA